MNLTTETLIERARAGDRTAREVLEQRVNQGDLEAAEFLLHEPPKPVETKRTPPYQDEQALRTEFTRILKGSEFEGHIEEHVGDFMCLWNPSLLEGLRKIPYGDRPAIRHYFAREFRAQYPEIFRKEPETSEEPDKRADDQKFDREFDERMKGDRR